MARLPSDHFNSKLFFSSDRSQTFYKVYKPRVQPEEDAFEETHGGVWSKDLHGDQVSGLKQLPPHRGNTCPPASLQSVEETVLLWVLRHVCYPVIKNPQQVPRTPSNTKMILKHCEWPGSIRVYQGLPKSTIGLGYQNLPEPRCTGVCLGQSKVTSTTPWQAQPKFFKYSQKLVLQRLQGTLHYLASGWCQHPCQI